MACIWTLLVLTTAVALGNSQSMEDLEEEYERLAASQRALVRQNILQYLYIDSRTRSDGDSGIKQTRSIRTATRPYYVEHHTANAWLAIHEHANHIRTIGMGEFIGVMNGVEFRTRHNDYALNQPHLTNNGPNGYNKVSNIKYPDVPPAVLNKATVDEQIAEMKKFFEAWAKQDESIRNYKPYFKAALCYLETAWTESAGSMFDFDSDRHYLDAKSWYDLEEKVRFNAYCGTKDTNENYAYLPNTIVGINDTAPIIAQYNYRILCHPLKDDLPLDRFRVVDDLSVRMRQNGGQTLEDYEVSRMARFSLNPKRTGNWVDGTRRPQFLDELMAEIPGKNNYGAYLEDNAYGNTAVSLIDNEPVNAAYYHRVYKALRNDAMGQQVRSRGYSDHNLFMAMTTHDEIIGSELEVCEGEDEDEVCVTYEQKWSYAIPMEIVYMTPLSNWNPYNLTFNAAQNNIPIAGGRNGLTPERAFNGTSNNKYYLTPSSFFADGADGDGDAADTSGGDVYVLDQEEVPKIVRASGNKIFFPEIEGVGVLRQRYPIAPLHGEGNTMMKELEALKDIVLSPKKYGHMYYEEPATGEPDISTTTAAPDTLYTTSTASTDGHIHYVRIIPEDMARLRNGQNITEEAEIMSGHNHELLLRGIFADGAMTGVNILECDKIPDICWDGHKGRLDPVASI